MDPGQFAALVLLVRFLPGLPLLFRLGLALSPIFVQVRLDQPYALVALFLLAAEAIQVRERDRPRWRLAAWACLGLAAMAQAARDGRAYGWQTLWNVILPLCKPGIAIGSIFVVTIVMGDFVTVRLMSGGQSASVGLMMLNAMSLLQYPAAAANAVVLLLLVLFTVAAMMRLVDIRKEL